jgi:IS30 family transposase
MTAAEARAAIETHGSQRAAAKALGVHHGTLGKIMSRDKARRGNKTQPQPTISSDTGKGRSLADFRAAHDKATIIPHKIREGLAKRKTLFEQISKKKRIECDICGELMMPVPGGGWDNDRLICMDQRVCGAEVVFPTSTELPELCHK